MQSFVGFVKEQRDGNLDLLMRPYKGHNSLKISCFNTQVYIGTIQSTYTLRGFVSRA